MLLFLCKIIMKQDWFIDWFNTKYYHILYKNRDYDEAQAFLKRLVVSLDIPKQNKILDLACGKGRHSIFLNNLGFNVVGVDLSEESIEKANESKNENLSFEVHDMRKTYMSNRFNYVFNLFTSFGYFEDDNENQHSINAMYSNLKEDGILVLDFLNAKKVVSNLVEKEVKKVDGIVFNITRAVENGFIIKKIKFIDERKDYSFEESVKALYKSDFENYFKQAGFSIKSIYGDYTLNEFNENSSDRLIFVCTK